MSHHSGRHGRGGGKAGTVALVVILILLLCFIAAGVWYLYTAYQANIRSLQSISNLQTVAQSDAATPSQPISSDLVTGTSGDEGEEEVVEEAELPDNPIDFTALKSINSDIFGWLVIPGTGIDLPLLQSPTDDEFYLTHDSAGAYDVYGSVYIELANSQDFSDPVTLIYGHNGEAQLRNLHYFADEEFFSEHEELTVYTPGHILTYRVISAYKFDNRHILNSFDFSNPTVLLQYFEYVENPDSLQVNVRSDLEPLTEDDRIIQLSTCMLDEFHGNNRWIVTAVLVDDQPTKDATTNSTAQESQEAL